MAYTARKLVTNALYLSGVVARSLQTVSGQQLSDGIDLFNDLLAIKNIDKRLIPFYKQYDLTAVVGQEKYYIPNLMDIETVTFNINNIRYSMRKVPRHKYFGYARVDDITSLPYSWHAERVKNGTDLYLYFLPSQAYPVKIWGKFGFDVVDENTDLETVFERAYLVYMRYELADFICSDYGITLQPQTADKYQELRNQFIDISPIDLTTRKITAFTSGGVLDWAQINLGKGWEPSR